MSHECPPLGSATPLFTPLAREKPRKKPSIVFADISLVWAQFDNAIIWSDRRQQFPRSSVADGTAATTAVQGAAVATAVRIGVPKKSRNSSSNNNNKNKLNARTATTRKRTWGIDVSWVLPTGVVLALGCRPDEPGAMAAARPVYISRGVSCIYRQWRQSL
jgi:hypothetical protein